MNDTSERSRTSRVTPASMAWLRRLRRAGHALDLIVKSEAHVNPWWTVVGAIVYLVSQGVRARGWHTILRAAYPEAKELRPRNTVSAYLAGAGLNALIPARGGDIVKLA